MKNEIIKYIKRNRVSTTEIADCLGKTGALEGVLPINPGCFCVGNVKWVYAYKSTNWDVHKNIVDTQEGDIVFIDAVECESRSVIGELVSKYILLYLQASAIVTNASMRDAAALIREKYPIWCKGVSPIGCFNTKPETDPSQEWLQEHKEKYDGAIMVCDDCGVVLIPKEFHTKEFLDKIVAIEQQEDIWFDRLDRKKESTFDIVCLKKYMRENDGDL